MIYTYAIFHKIYIHCIYIYNYKLWLLCYNLHKLCIMLCLTFYINDALYIHYEIKFNFIVFSYSDSSDN